ncbi:MAG TPA: ferrochelatase [Bacillota bacterium]
MGSSSQAVGLLVMAYGTPETLDDLEAYYTHIRGGRPPSPEALKELEARYRLIGERSPLNVITRRQAVGTAQRLAWRLGVPVVPYVGSKHARPFIGDAVRRMVADGIRRAVALVMAPQYSSMSVASYQKAVQEALAKAGDPGDPVDIVYVDHWHQHPGFVAALGRRVRSALAELPAHAREKAAVVFTAHSLPERILQHGDPYPRHLRETAEAVAREAGLRKWLTAYQSAGMTADPWLGPDICDVIRDLAASGVPGVVVCAAGFVADHLEVFYDLDIEARDTAAEVGIAFARTASPNDAPDFLDALAGVAAAALTRS